MSRKLWYDRPVWLVAGFALLNLVMYLSIRKFWIGGSSFLPMVGRLGPDGRFLFAFVVNLGVIAGAMIGAATHKEFRLRLPRGRLLPRAVLGGAMIGVGVTLCPGTCTTSFVTGMPMLSVASVLSGAGIVLGALVAYRLSLGRIGS